MLPNRKGRRNGDRRRAKGTPIGSRNLQPREQLVLPPDYYDDQTGGDFYDCEWEVAPVVRPDPGVPPADENDDDLTEAVAKVRAKREQARLTEIEARAAQDNSLATHTGSGGVESLGDPAPAADGHDQPGPSATAGDATEYEPLSPDEVRRLVRRDRRVVKRLRDAEQVRLARLNEPAALAGESAYAVVCHGAVLRLAVERALDAHAELHHSPCFEPLEERQARLKELMAVAVCGGKQVTAYDAWVAANRQELADEELLDLLAGSKEERAEAKARLTELDKKYRTGKSDPAAPAAAAVPLPLIYQKEFRGKVRAYPEWVAPVLRQVARKHAHQIPAMAFVLAQLAYWTEPKDGTGRPRAKRAKVIDGRWWVVLGYGQIEKQTPVSKGQAKRAIGVFGKLKLVETLAAKGANVGTEPGGVDFGPNTVFLRVNTGVLDPLVQKVMTVNSKSGFGK